MELLNYIKYLSLAMIILFAPACEKKFNEVSDKMKSVSGNTSTLSKVDITPVSVFASSTLPTAYNFTYYPEMTIDGNNYTWWSPANQTYTNEWIQFNFGQSTRLHAIKILNGSHYPNFIFRGVNYGDLYYLNHILTSARLEFSNGNSIRIEMSAIDGLQTIEFPECTTTFVRLYPERVIQGHKWKDVCISEVKFN